MADVKSHGKTFEQFTNLYSLSKTLRFELRPVGETVRMLEEMNVFRKDELIQNKYEATKPYFDRLHREFVEEALADVSLSGLTDYFEAWKEWYTDKKDVAKRKKLDVKAKNLRKEVTLFFDAKAQEWVKELYSGIVFKHNDIEFLFEEAVFDLLKARFGGETDTVIEGQSIFDSWKGFTGYFIKFFETRRNFYNDDGKASALATRIVDQNLQRFCTNLLVMESLSGKIDYTEVEKLNGASLSEIFSLDYYNKCLLQAGIDDYNAVLGGRTLENGEKEKGMNECINLNRQKTAQKLPFFTLLDKQLLSEKKVFIDGIQNDEQLLVVLHAFRKSAEEKIGLFKNLFEDFMVNNLAYDLEKIYISREAFNTIAHRWTNETSIFEKWLYGAMKDDKSAKYDKNNDSYKFPNFIALSFIKGALDGNEFEGEFWKARYYESPDFVGNTRWMQFLHIFHLELKSLFKREVINNNTGTTQEIGYLRYESDFDGLLRQFEMNQNAKVVIKNFADEVLFIYQMAKYFAVEKKRAWVAEYELDTFYTSPGFGYLSFYVNAYEEIVQVYNHIRNYLTQKPYSEEKWKLNFENPTLAVGWDKNKESDNSALIFRKDGRYFLGIMAKGNSKIFSDRNEDKYAANGSEDKYEKVVYKFFPDQAKMFPKVCFSKKGLEFFRPSEEILNIYNNAEFKKGDTFSVQALHKLIDFYKDCLTKYEGWRCYIFRHIRPTREYVENIGEFFRDVSEDGYKIEFQEVSALYLKSKNESGALYLFEIHNKDWNLDKARGGKQKKSTKNLHTLYFESLFSAENVVQNFPIKLNGQAEIFYRPKTDVKKLGMKNDKQGNSVVNHKRYNENKIFFHVPLTFNRTKSESRRFNSTVNAFLADNLDVNIIGVDRGEKHLAYYSVVSRHGEILECDSLNKIGEVDYAQKLAEKAIGRENARRDWQSVEGIKDLKKGYISQVVRKLADLAIKYNAIIVFEDLNMRFKQIRGGIEKSVYQQLEKALIEKLNFLVDKSEHDPNKAGHLLKAFQLAAPFESFQDMGKQTGIVFYTQAAYTSKIDPVTGWRPHLYLKYSNAEKAKADVMKFLNVTYVKERFEFTYDVKVFQQNNKEYPQNTVWTVCSSVERFRWDRTLNQNKGGYVHYPNLTDNFRELFAKYGINLSAGDFQNQIDRLDKKENVKFFKDFIFFFNLVCQIRNTDNREQSKNEGNDDFILSPVEPFFDSREFHKFGKNLPKNGDDNGAYNIARKGIVILDKISDFKRKNGDCEKLKWSDLYVSSVDWDNYIRVVAE